MKITGFSIKIGSERSYTTSDAFNEKRELYGGNLSSSLRDRVTISRESSARVTNETGFSASSKTVIRRKASETSQATKPVIETITRALTGRNVSITSLYSKSNEQRISPQTVQRSQPPFQTESMMEITRSYVHKEKESVSIASSGTLKTKDGMEISFDLLLQMQRGLVKEGQDITTGDSRLLTDPLVINFSGGPPELSDSVFNFDIDSDGASDKIHGLKKGTGFLTLDRNGDGKINNGTELFGPSSGNGFGELSMLDGNKDGWLDEDDTAFSELKIWSKDEETGEDRLIGLEEAGIGAIYTGSSDSEFTISGKDGQADAMMRRTGIFVKNSGEVQNIFQIDLSKEMPEQAPQSAPPTPTQQGRRTEELKESVSEARAMMIKDIRESIARMKESIKKTATSDNEMGSETNDLFERIQKRLEDLMKFFDEKTREIKKTNKSTSFPEGGKISLLA